MDKIENMRTFVRVVEAGSITRAADRMEIAKSAVSRRLKELEEHLGVQLFHRTTRQLNLTDTGQGFYARATRILEDLEEAELAASQAHGTLYGQLRVAVPLSFGLMHLGPAITEFMRLHPEVEFDLDFNDRTVDLMQEGFDLAVRIGQLPDSSLIARRVASIKGIMCASPEYLARHGTPQTPADLIKHQCLVYTLMPDYHYWQLSNDDGTQQRVRVRAYLKASNGEFLRDAALAGMGIVYSPTFILYDAIEDGRLVPVLSDYHRPEVNAYAIYPPTRHLSHRVRAFVQFLADRFEGVPYWEKCLKAK